MPRARHIFLGASVAIAALYASSPFWTGWVSVGRWAIGSVTGRSSFFIVHRDDTRILDEMGRARFLVRGLDASAPFLWLPSISRSSGYTGPALVINVPYWIPLGATLISTGLLYCRHSRRVRPGHCPKCRYDLSTLPPDSPCPECGRPSSPRSGGGK